MLGIEKRGRIYIYENQTADGPILISSW